MKILAFETSCDDTSVAIVEDGTRVLANVRKSQIEHSVYGGVVPEIAARIHAERWREVLEACLEKAQLTINDIDYLAVTNGPGLQTSLLTGTVSTSFLSLTFQKKVIPVHHILGHIASVILERKLTDIRFPILSLTVSGGHTDFYVCENFATVKKIGQTIDDAAGEAFDKCAKLLGLGYPGGPIVSEWAKKGDRKKFKFPIIMLEKESLNFSFSGLKAAVYRITEEEKKKNGKLSDEFIADVCASFEQAVLNTFLKKIDRAFDAFPDIETFSFVGGVSANTFLRENFKKFCEQKGINFMTTKQFEYCMDNAAMIASAAYFLIQKNQKIAQTQYIDAVSNLEIK